MADGSIIIDTKIDSTGLDKQLSNLKGSLQGATDALNGLTNKALIGFAALGAAIAPSIKLASDLAESANAVKVVFGDASTAIEEFGSVAQAQAGLTSAEFNQMASQIGAGLINAGQSQKDAAAQSVELTKRAADMASVFNTDVSEALTAIQAGLRGESEPLRWFAVGLDEAAVNAKAVEMGLAKSVATVDNYGKSQARLALIMQQSSKFAGDFVNTSNQLANSTRITTAMIKEEAAQAGAKLLPIVLDVIKGFLEWAKEGDRLKNIMQGMADAIKWAVESGFAQGVLAAVVAIKALTLAMTAYQAIMAIVAAGSGPLILGITAIGAAVGVATALFISHNNEVEAYNKKLIEQNALVAETKKAALGIIGPQTELSDAQKISAEQVAELVKLYPQLDGVLKAGQTSLKEARLETEKMAESQRVMANQLASQVATKGINEQQERISELRKAIEKLKAFLETPIGMGKSTEAESGRKNLARYQQALADAEKKAGEFRAELAKLREESFFGAGGFKPTGTSKPAAAPAAAVATPEVTEGLTVDYELRKANVEWQDKLNRASEEANRIAEEKPAEPAGTVDYAARIAEIQRTDKIIQDMAQAEPEESWQDKGAKIMKKLAAGITESAPAVLSAARKTVEIIGQVVTSGIAIVSKIAQGVGNLLSGMATFDPKAMFESLGEFATGLQDFFTNDIAQSPIFFDAGVTVISDLLEGISDGMPDTVEIFENAVESIVKTITSEGPDIVTNFVDIMTDIIKAVATALPLLLEGALVLFGSLVEAITTTAPDTMNSLVTILVNIVQAIVDALPLVLEAAIGIALALIQALVDNMPDIIQAIVDTIDALLTAIADNLGLFIDAGISLTKSLISGLIDAMPDLLDAIVDALPDVITGIIDALPELIGGIVTAIIEAFTSLFSGEGPSLLEIGWNIIKGIGDGIWEALLDLGKMLEDGWNAFVQGVKDFFGIKSPSKLFAKLGGYMADGIGVGINDTDIFGQVSDGLGAFTGQVSDALTVEPSLKMSTDAVNSVMAGLSNAAGLAVSVAGSAALSASSNQAIQIKPAPVILDGREIGRVAFEQTDSMVRMAYGA